MKILDYAGLSYFWGKIKAWCNSLFALDADVVHKTGNETVGGVKTFSNRIYAPQASLRGIEFDQTASNSGHGGYIDFHFNGDISDYTSRIIEPESGRLYFYAISRFISQNGVVSIRSSSLTRGELPSETQYNKWYISYADKNGNEIGCDQYSFTPEGRIIRRIITYGWVPYGSASSGTFAQLAVGFQAGTVVDGVQTALGVPFASCPSTPDTGGGDDIVTRNWIPKDTRIVHTTGAETVDGQKTFTAGIKGGTSSTDAVFGSADATSAMAADIYGGNAFNDGATVTAFGKAHQYSPGFVRLRPATSSTVYKQLIAKPDGTLTWDGQEIQTSSDERLKTPLSAVPDEVLDAWGDVQWGQFQYLEAVRQKGGAARLHLGLVAQRVKAAFEARGLDACAYGILCYEREEDLWTVRYAEAQAMEACRARRENARLKKRVAGLEERLAALERRIA